MKTQPKISLFLFSLLVTTSSLITLSLSAERCHPNDKNALLEIKAQLGPNTSFFSSWKPNTDCCKTWINVGCDNQTGRVNYLTIGQNNELVGQIPPILGQLTALEVLYFNDIPGLTGPIPSSISNLVNLQDLEFFRTNLTGPIPESLDRLNKLTTLELSENRLTGPIPDSLSRIPNLKQLNLFKNWLSGPIPRSLSRAGFSWLDLSNNRFTGDASFLFRNKKLILIYLKNNAFSFDFSNVVINSGLQGLDISHNMIHGSLPRQLSQLPLRVFNVSHNQLCGPVPTGKWLTRFGADSFGNNQCLCGGPLPACN